MHIGEKIKSIRVKKNMSRKDIAKKSGISEISIRKYEKGERNPKLENIKNIAKALNISIYELIKDDNLEESLKHLSSEVILPLIKVYKNNEDLLKNMQNDTFQHYKLFTDYLYVKFKNQIELLEKENKFSAIDLIQLYEEINKSIEKKLNNLKEKK
ncbi:helix-turn-helix transcriptional regulator [Clostridium botulinum]|nr:helix-turn-helix transcriptional regulator [Clostridium botulinum]